MDYRKDGTRTTKEKNAGLGTERKPGLKREGDTHFKTNSWVEAGDCAFGNGETAQNTVFYNVFAPSELAKRPKT